MGGMGRSGLLSGRGLAAGMGTVSAGMLLGRWGGPQTLWDEGTGYIPCQEEHGVSNGSAGCTSPAVAALAAGLEGPGRAGERDGAGKN